MLFDKTILVSVISAKELVDKAIKIHSLSRTAAAALGRKLDMGKCCVRFKKLAGRNSFLFIDAA